MAIEHKELLKSFSVPPNVFDGYITASELREKDNAETLRASLQDFKRKTDSHKQAVKAQIRKYNDVKKKLDSLTRRLDNAVKQKRELEKVHEEYIVTTQAARENSRKLVEEQSIEQQRQAKAEIDKHVTSVLELRSQKEKYEMQCAQITASLSWRLTLPVRWLEHRLSRLIARNYPSYRSKYGQQRLQDGGIPDPVADHFLKQLLDASNRE